MAPLWSSLKRGETNQRVYQNETVTDTSSSDMAMPMTEVPSSHRLSRLGLYSCLQMAAETASKILCSNLDKEQSPSNTEKACKAGTERRQRCSSTHTPHQHYQGQHQAPATIRERGPVHIVQEALQK